MSEQFKPVKIGDVSSDGKFTPVSRDDFNALRPEVREAIGYFACSPYSAEDREKARVIRAELLRLTVRNAELEAKATRDYEWFNDLLTENKKAEAELAALKARIAGSPLVPLTKVALGNGYSVTVSASMSVNDVDALHGKRVRLVAEE